MFIHLDKTPECGDGETDGQNRSGYYSGLHYEQCRRAVKITFGCEVFLSQQVH